jgi:hypothetical protein
MKRKSVVAVLLVTGLLGGCAAPLTTYKPADNQIVTYNQGVGTIADDTPDFSLLMYPTFKYQSPSDLPTFTLMVQDRSGHSIDFNPESVRAYLDERQCHVYTLEQRVSEIKRHKIEKQVALAIVGGLAAGASAYAASHTTTNYSGYGYVGRTPVVMSGSIRTYDPASGILAGAAVGAATGVGIRQLENAAAYQEQAAQGIFQHSTVAAGTTVGGQIVIKPATNGFSTLRLEVPIEGQVLTFTFLKSTTSY